MTTRKQGAPIKNIPAPQSTPVSPKDAGSVKGGGARRERIATNHNQSLRQ